MRCLSLLLLAPILLQADEKPKPNTLTQKEIEEGWILLFDGETTFGWKVEGDVKVQDGELRLGGTKKSSIITTAAFGVCEIRFDYFLNGKGSCSAGPEKRQFSEDREYMLHWVEMAVSVESNGKLGGWYKNPTSDSAIVFASAVPGGGLGVPKGQVSSFIPVPIRFDIDGGGKLSLRSIRLKPTKATSLFNAKDLSGWKVFDDPKRSKSQWTVTKEGWLNVKNGPGDLQTEKKFDDFILQLECISNGKALNSGIFFRCMPDQYQNGYEAQIQNGFKDNDRTKPADFGTGAIYRRIAARKVVPNDNEWFTMTVLAHGKHFATWVNGYQTVDWTDDRKENENPRNGYRAAAGHISIQGHDPTTDLSFRNIRIAELRKEKKD